jgi:3-dehydroquinate synthase
MILALELSRDMGLFSSQDVDRVRRHFADVGLPMEITAIPESQEWSAPALINHMRHDKKVLAGQMRFILARGIGDAFVTAEVDERHVTKIIERSLALDMDASGVYRP